MARGEYRLRVCYRKAGRLRWLSHLEVARSLERVIRRSGLAYSVTRGFSPHMKIAFGPALPVGTAGEREYLDVWVTRYTESEDALTRLKNAAPADLEPSSAQYMAEAAPSLGAAATVATYEVRVKGKEVDPRSVQAALDVIRARGQLQVEQKRKTKVFDLALSLPKEPSVKDDNGTVVVEMAVRMGPQGSLRPEVLLQSAFAATSLEGAVTGVTRTDTLVEDEDGGWSRPV
ncbi:MAG: TIGR03936 family radical SAM-associated protein [Actinomycetota bacterium]|nr:TIGR03936 family radical SAM-associated protein [Actinomycetota bacterium]